MTYCIVKVAFSAREAAELLGLTCSAVHAAERRGLLKRDLPGRYCYSKRAIENWRGIKLLPAQESRNDMWELGDQYDNH